MNFTNSYSTVYNVRCTMCVVNIIKSILGPTWCQLHWTKVRNEGACEDNICKPLLCPKNIIMWSSRDMHVHVNALCDPTIDCDLCNATSDWKHIGLCLTWLKRKVVWTILDLAVLVH